jgi:transposase
MSDVSIAAYVSIDWADARHAVSLVSSDAPERIERQSLEQSPEAIEAWVQALRERFAGRKIAICLEQSKGALMYSLMQYDNFVLFPINPRQLARFRQALHPSGRKDDPVDADLMVELLQKHGAQLRPWRPDDAQTRLIGMLVADRRHWVDERTRVVNALKSRLKQYFPLALAVLADVGSDLACQFLLRWNRLEDLQRSPPDEVAGFFRQHHCQRPILIAERLQKIAAARPLTADPAVVESGQRHVRALAEQLRGLLDTIEQYDRRLEHLFQAHTDGPIFASLPGAGAAMAPRLLVAFGVDRQRLESAQQLQQYSGIAPVTRQSGQQRHVTQRWACPKFLRQTFHEFAQHSRRQSPWAAAYYALQRSRGKNHQAALRGLAFKWIRIIYRCWKDRTLYNEITYYQQLVQRHSPLIPFLGKKHAQPKNPVAPA